MKNYRLVTALTLAVILLAGCGETAQDRTATQVKGASQSAQPSSVAPAYQYPPPPPTCGPMTADAPKGPVKLNPNEELIETGIGTPVHYTGPSHLYVSRPNPDGPAPLTKWFTKDPNFSDTNPQKTASQVLFERQDLYKKTGVIMATSLDLSSGLHQITPEVTNSSDQILSVSPDGQQLLYRKTKGIQAADQHGNFFSIYRINLDGSGNTFVFESGGVQPTAGWGQLDRSVIIKQPIYPTRQSNYFLVKSDGTTQRCNM